MLRLLIPGLLLAGIQIGSAQSYYNLLLNGSFEQMTFSGNGVAYPNYGPSSVTNFTLPGWTFPTGFNQFFLEYGQPFFPAKRYTDGRQAVCLNGDGFPVELYQTFPTVPGRNYLLTFAQSDETVAGPSVSTLEVSVAGVTRVFTRSNDTGWVYKTIHFTAPSTSTLLKFRDLTSGAGEATGRSPFLDEVSVMEGSTTIAGTNTPIPGGTGTFSVVEETSTSSNDGGGKGRTGSEGESPTVVFRGLGPDFQVGIYGRIDASILKIADTNTPIPGGSGAFTGFGVGSLTAPTISGSNVAFIGTGAGGQAGLYGQIGGTLVTIADLNTPIPGGVGTFNTYPGDPCISGDGVAFIGSGNGGQQGVYIRAMPVDPCRLIANLTTAIPGGVGTFTFFPDPSLSGTNTVFVGEGTGGQRGVYAEIAGVLIRIADTNTPVPGATNQFTAFRSAVISGTNVAFAAEGTNGFQGVYARLGGGLTRVADTTTPIPGGTGNFTGFTNASMEGTAVAFLAAGAGQKGIYHWSGGRLRRVIETGDVLGGKTLTNLAFTRYGFGGGRVVYTAYYSDGSHDLQSSPVEPTPRPLEITSTERLGADLRLGFTTQVGSNYVVWARSNLTTGTWTPLPGTNFGNGDTNFLTLTNALQTPENFFRIQRLP